MEILFVTYDETFLNLSRQWLSDPEIKRLTMTPDIEEEKQRKWFETLSKRNDYLIWGILADKKPIGAVGIKNIDHAAKCGEYWGYIGEKEYIGHGIGNQMISAMCNKARDLGLNTLTLKVAQYNKRACALYLRAGFVIVSVNDAIYQMNKSLEAGRMMN